MIKFYDTNALLNLREKAFEEKFFCSHKTLEELEHIKTSANKDDDVKFRARLLGHLFDENENYEICNYSINEIRERIQELGVEETPDSIILTEASFLKEESKDEIEVYSDDISFKNIGKNIFGLPVVSISEPEETYFGYVEITPTEEELSYIYMNPQENTYNLNINEYLVIKNTENEVIDELKWNGTELVKVKYQTFKSTLFGNVKPYNNDPYQELVMDSMSSNKITMVKGTAGTGKSYLSLGYLLYMLEKHKIEKIVVFCNTVATANAAKLGLA